jgi:protein SCO1/2
MIYTKLHAKALLLMALALLVPAAWSHGGHEHGGHEGREADAPAATSRPVKLTETQLLDQDGRKLRLASDVVANRIVVVSFVYTNCTDICPMVSQTFAQVQQKLGALMDSRVRLVSLTVDPKRDTPAVLKEYASHFAPKAGWLWLTGDQASVTAAHTAFGVTIRNPENHPGQIVIGDPKTGRWTRLYDIDKPEEVLAKVNELLAPQRAEKTAAIDGTSANSATGMRTTHMLKQSLAASHSKVD